MLRMTKDKVIGALMTWEIPGVLGAPASTEDEDQIDISYYKSQYHKQYERNCKTSMFETT